MQDGSRLTFWRRFFSEAAGALNRSCGLLDQLDAKIGDAEHGTTISKGFEAIVKSDAFETAECSCELLNEAGRVLARVMGGSTGPLYSSFFFAVAASDSEQSKAELTVDYVLDVLRLGVDEMQSRGGASVGDKTMMDAYIPAVVALSDAVGRQLSPQKALSEMCRAGREGLEATVGMSPRKGRSRYLGERAVGHQDPGATSACLVLEAIAQACSECLVERPKDA